MPVFELMSNSLTSSSFDLVFWCNSCQHCYCVIWNMLVNYGLTKLSIQFVDFSCHFKPSRHILNSDSSSQLAFFKVFNRQKFGDGQKLISTTWWNCFWRGILKGQFISEWNFGVLKSPKKATKFLTNFCPSFIVCLKFGWLFERFEDNKISFWE